MKKVLRVESEPLDPTIADNEIRDLLPIRRNCACEGAFIAETLDDVFRLAHFKSLWAICPHCGSTRCIRAFTDLDVLRASTVRHRSMAWDVFVRPFTWRRYKAEVVYEDD